MREEWRMTPTEPTSESLTLGVFLLLRDLIGDRLGVWFEESKRDLLASKLADRMIALGLLVPGLLLPAQVWPRRRRRSGRH